MIERQLNIENIFKNKTHRRIMARAASQDGMTLPSSMDDDQIDEESTDEIDPREYIYLGYFSLAGLSFFTAMVHFFLFFAVIISSSSLKKDIKPNRITQSINVWVPELRNQNIMFPETRELGPNVSLAENCRPFIPKTVPYDGQIATIFPKILLYCEIDNRISIALFFLLSFAFQFFKAVNIKAFQEHPCKQELWLGDTFYQNLVKGKVSKRHFIEYSLSATLMTLVMITQIGITDLTLIINVCVNTWACMIIGMLTEFIVDAEDNVEFGNQRYLGYPLSFISHILGWIPITSVIFTMIVPLTTYKTCIDGKVDIPDFVFIFVVGEVLLFCSFGWVQFMSVGTAIEIRNKAACQLNCLKRNMERQMKQNQPVLRQHKHKGYEMIVRPSNAVDDNTSQSIKNDFERKCLQVNADKKGAMVQNACTAEAYYVILSLFAKTFLALTIYIGINMQP
jgi:hypothetical protein